MHGLQPPPVHKGKLWPSGHRSGQSRPREYSSGEPATKLADELGCNRKTINRALKNALKIVMIIIADKEAAPEGAARGIILLLTYPATSGRTSRLILSPFSSSTFSKS